MCAVYRHEGDGVQRGKVGNKMVSLFSISLLFRRQIDKERNLDEKLWRGKKARAGDIRLFGRRGFNTHTDLGFS